MRLARTAVLTIQKHHLFKKGDKILVAISGGPDSVALLHFLVSLKKKFSLTLIAAHLDHMLRPDSHADKVFVVKLCRALGVPVIAEQIDIKKYCQHMSLEEAARNKRQEFLFSIATFFKADAVALGHTQDDQAETVLMRLIRGSGLYGLNAILPKRQMKGVTVIRPLIEVSRKDIEQYLKKKRMRARFDETNAQDIFLRNKIRKTLLPYLAKAYNPNIKSALSNLADIASVDYEYLHNQADTIFKRVSRVNARGVSLTMRELSTLHPAMVRLVLRLAYAHLKGDTRRLTFAHIKEVEHLLASRPLHSIVDLPSGISVIKKKNFTVWYRRIS